MIRIRFPETVDKRRALGFLAGRFSFKSWSSGEMILPPEALSFLALEGIPFIVDGPATYEQYGPTVRDLLPLRFNDGQPVPDDLVVQTLLELEEQFGSVSSETQVIRGRWRQGQQIFRDDLVRVFMDVPDTIANREFFAGYKEQLKARFRQLEIWLTTYPIEVL